MDPFAGEAPSPVDLPLRLLVANEPPAAVSPAQYREKLRVASLKLKKSKSPAGGAPVPNKQFAEHHPSRPAKSASGDGQEDAKRRTAETAGVMEARYVRKPTMRSAAAGALAAR